MTAATVGALYDALHAFESPRRGDGAYPIHKRVAFPGGHADVYDWLADRLDLRGTDRVLDVGCGVGFGAIRLAERGAARVTGLTVSPAELRFASQAVARHPRARHVELLEGSFDRPPPGPYDVVVAVESLKHSADLAVTLRALHDVLAPGGRLVVVEDVLVGDPSSSDARGLARDWLLAALHTQADYASAAPFPPQRVVDLTEGVRPRNRLELSVSARALSVAMRWRRSNGAALRAFRGGVHLERLYAAGRMRYVAMFWAKERVELR